MRKRGRPALGAKALIKVVPVRFSQLEYAGIVKAVARAGQASAAAPEGMRPATVSSWIRERALLAEQELLRRQMYLANAPLRSAGRALLAHLAAPTKLQDHGRAVDLENLEMIAAAAAVFDPGWWWTTSQMLDRDVSSDADAEHIAAADPITVLALIARIRELERLTAEGAPDVPRKVP